MLGPALSQLLGRLLVIPDDERSQEQKALLSELASLLVANTAEEPRAIAGKSRIMANTLSDGRIELFSITEPFRPTPESITEPYEPPALQRCSRCNQAFPITTQPKA